MLDKQKRNEVVESPSKAYRFKLVISSGGRINITKSCPTTHDESIARLLLSMVANERPPWCSHRRR